MLLQRHRGGSQSRYPALEHPQQVSVPGGVGVAETTGACTCSRNQQTCGATTMGALHASVSQPRDTHHMIICGPIPQPRASSTERVASMSGGCAAARVHNPLLTIPLHLHQCVREPHGDVQVGSRHSHALSRRQVQPLGPSAHTKHKRHHVHAGISSIKESRNRTAFAGSLYPGCWNTYGVRVCACNQDSNAHNTDCAHSLCLCVLGHSGTVDLVLHVREQQSPQGCRTR